MSVEQVHLYISAAWCHSPLTFSLHAASPICAVLTGTPRASDGLFPVQRQCVTGMCREVIKCDEYNIKHSMGIKMYLDIFYI